MTNMALIGIFGGTFNPIHNGHLVLAQTVFDTLNCSQIRFIPAAIPPHKTTPNVSAQHRAKMVQLAIQDTPAFILDNCELERKGASYTIETLQLLEKKLPHQLLCLIIGQDSYVALPTWHRWRELLDHCHILVVHRADTEQVLHLHHEHQNRLVPIAQAAEHFARQTHGLISYLPLTPPDISSTQLRSAFKQTRITTTNKIPEVVLRYIQTHHLYQD